MQLTHYISPDEIIIPLKATTKEAAYKELVEYLAKRKKLKDFKGLTKAIFDREATTSTFLPIGVAIPHARVPNVKDIEIVMGVSPNPIKDTAVDSPL